MWLCGGVVLQELDTHKTALDLATEKGWVDKVQILEVRPSPHSHALAYTSLE